MAIVYIHRKKTNNSVFYIGISTDKKRAYSKSSRNPYWKNIINKHDYIVDIIEKDINIETAKELEIFLIEIIGIDNLANITLGGESGNGLHHSEEAKRKISLANKGKIISEEQKKSISKTLMGHFVSEKTREKIRKANLVFYKNGIFRIKKMKLKGIKSRILSKKQREKIGTYTAKSILQFDNNAKFINEFKSSLDACRSTNIDPSSIIKVCKCKRKTAGGYIWKYKKKEVNHG